MEARVITVQVDVYRMDKAIKIYEETVAPAVKMREGGIGALLLVDRKSGNAISITLWESEEKEKAARESGFMQEQIAKFESMLIATPEIDAYEVIVKDI
jgi:heme-degrading monooxygenase HmoA